MWWLVQIYQVTMGAKGVDLPDYTTSKPTFHFFTTFRKYLKNININYQIQHQHWFFYMKIKLCWASKGLQCLSRCKFDVLFKVTDSTSHCSETRSEEITVALMHDGPFRLNQSSVPDPHYVSNLLSCVCFGCLSLTRYSSSICSGTANTTTSAQWWTLTSRNTLLEPWPISKHIDLWG